MTVKMFKGPNGESVSMSEAIRRTYDSLDSPTNLDVLERVKSDYGVEPRADMLRTVLRRHTLGQEIARGKAPKMKKVKEKKQVWDRTVKRNFTKAAVAMKEENLSIEDLLTTLEDVTRQQEELTQLRHKLIIHIEKKLKEHAEKLEELEKPIASPRPVTVSADSSVITVG